MKGFLQDLVAHTHTLTVLPLVKVTATAANAVIESVAEDRSVMLYATTHAPVSGLGECIFGMPNLNKLDLHLKCPEYKTDATIKVVQETRDDKKIPTGLHFTNAAGDYENDYRFMNEEIISAKVKRPKLKVEIIYDVEFVPTGVSIQRLKHQAAAHTEETVFQLATVNDDLVFRFGDASTHAGSFVFHSGITTTLKNTWSWPVSPVLGILGLNGDLTMRVSDQGSLQIIVDSGTAVYHYTLPAYTK
jgi:hypothetical protein